MLNISSIIKINDFTVPFFESIVIEKRSDLIMDTCTINVPNVEGLKGVRIDSFFNIGDFVEIDLGYNGNKDNRFRGYINRIMPGRNLVIECLDEGYKYKFKTIEESKVFKSVKIEDFVTQICPEISVLSVDANIGDWEVDKGVSFMEVLNALKDVFGLNIYFRGELLVIGVNDATGTVILDMQQNCIKDESSLESNDISNSNKIVEGKSVLDNDGIKEVISIFVNKDGVFEEKPNGIITGTIKIPNLTRADLIEVCSKKLEKLEDKPIEGVITTLGEPVCQYGMFAQIIDRENPDIEGYFIIKSVETGINNSDGFYQKIGF